MELEGNQYKKGSVESWDKLWQGGSTIPWVEDLGDAYDQWQVFEWVKYQYLDGIFPKSTSKKPVKSLEVGCGTAGVSVHFCLKGYQTTMLDTSDEALKVTRLAFADKNVEGTFVKGNALDMPFPDNSFDVVMSFGLVEHFEEVQPLIDEMVRVLKPGGLFFADIVPKRFSVQTLFDVLINTPLIIVKKILKGRQAEILAEISRLYRPPFYENSYSMNEYREFMERAGLEKIFITGNNPFPSIHVGGLRQKIWVYLLIKAQPLWRAFDRSDNWFCNVIWARAWWGKARKK